MIELLLAVALDLVMGEYPDKFHPVVWFGKMAEVVDRSYRRRNPAIDFLVGVLCTTLVSTFALLLSLTPKILPFPLNFVAEVYLLKSSFAIKSLYLHVRRTIVEDLEEQRRAVSMIVSRDVSKLDRPHLISASIESLAENIVDSVTSPIFYYLLFGLSGALVYRAINTLDAMMGYRNDRYEFFGKFCARLDDILNFVPSRITVLLFLPFNPRKVLRYYRSARFKINGDKPIACMSAILGVWLEKEGHYRFEGREPTLKDVERALRIYTVIVVVYIALAILSKIKYI